MKSNDSLDDSLKRMPICISLFIGTLASTMLVCGAATACKATIATARRSPRCLSISIARGQCTRVCSSGVLLPAQPHAVAGCRSFSSTVLRQMAASSSHEALKRDFGRWLRGELALLAAMLAVGVSGVYVYQVRSPLSISTFQYQVSNRFCWLVAHQNRENAPVKRITRLLALAEQSAQEVSVSMLGIHWRNLTV